MKKISLLISVFILFTFFGYSQDSNKYPLFQINDTFSHTQPKDSKIKPQNYQLTSLAGFKIDCSKYDFTLIRSMNEGNDPDGIFIISKSGNYFVELNIKGETTIDASTMYSLDNPKKKFISFEKGDTPILGLGTLKRVDGESKMMTYWVTMIDVK